MEAKLTALIALISGILGIMYIFSNIRTSRMNKKNLEIQNKIKELELKEAERKQAEAEAEIKRKKEQSELEEKRNIELDKKLEKQVYILTHELDGITKMLNKVITRIDETNVRIDKTNSRIDEGNKIRDQHINDSNYVPRFLEEFRLSFNNALHYWHPEDANLKTILENWGNIIEKFGLDYIECKIKKIKSHKAFSPEARMSRLVESFYSMATGMVSGRNKNVTYGEFLQSNEIHYKSQRLAEKIKTNGFKDMDEFNQLVSDYIEEFSTEYTKLADKWYNMSQIKYAS